MVWRAYGAGLGSAVALCLASSTRGSHAFVLPSSAPRAAEGVSRACSRQAFAASAAHTRVRPRSLAVAAGGSAVGSASATLTDGEEEMRVSQIQGFTDKVRVPAARPGRVGRCVSAAAVVAKYMN